MKFAVNEMTIVYTEKSRRAKEIDQKNWFNILLDEKVNIGRAEPNSDWTPERRFCEKDLAGSERRSK